MNLPARLRSLARRALDVESRLLIRNSSWFLITNLNAAACDFLRSVVLARGLGAESFGIFILVTTLVRTIQEFFNLNVGTAVVKFGAEYVAAGQPGRLAALLKACFGLAAITAVASVLFVAAASYLAYDTFITRPGLEGYVQLYAVAAGISFFDYISVSLLNLYFRFRLNSIVKMLLDVVELAILGTAVWLRPGDLGFVFWAAVLALFIKGLAYNGAALWEMRGTLQSHLDTPLSAIGPDRGRIGRFLVNNSLSRTVHTLIFSGDVLLLGALTGPVQVGYYSIAKKLAFSVLRLTDPMASSVFPQLAKLVAERNLASVRTMLRRITLLFGALFTGVFLVALVAGRPVMVMVYGEEFRPAGTALLVLVAAAGIGAALFWSTSLIVSLGRVDARLRGYLAALAASAALAWWLVPAMGATGLAVAMLAAIVIMQSVFVWVCDGELRRPSGSAV
jgi:O-antigen/teichoic acid export membrane protein